VYEVIGTIDGGSGVVLKLLELLTVTFTSSFFFSPFILATSCSKEKEKHSCKIYCSRWFRNYNKFSTLQWNF
jgi:hypothetical protein